ncbi:hypothetical protein L1987_46356 [Smallanthus sonchifolius]|uniref:Uncharacterized protein n=1 Tax=Smallanthus sonchifolius TaxID=185202 RepID=A0ACB9G0I2_9ASTR|nr:hypothetical protein L1987_46356 [Smallanthus sonchifolius]
MPPNRKRKHHLTRLPPLAVVHRRLLPDSDSPARHCRAVTAAAGLPLTAVVVLRGHPRLRALIASQPPFCFWGYPSFFFPIPNLPNPRVTMDVDLHDWEVLDDSTSTGYLDGIEGMIRSDYFSIDSRTTHVEDVADQISVESDNPSWIDPTNYSTTKPIGYGSDTGASDNELGIVEIASRQVAFDESKPGVYEKVAEEKIVEASEQGDAERNRVAVWWKLPLDLLKYCLFKASPVWTISVVIGVVILGRRLYKMKQKTRTLQLKVTMDDKKASQVMSRAARLNEAFSVVKRSPIIRPSLPAAGISPWAMMALR